MTDFFPLPASTDVVDADGGVARAERAVSCSLLPEYPVFVAQGEDAASFLHGQLTNDVTGIGSGQARLAGYCTAKGRLLATMVIWPATGEAAGVMGFMRQGVSDAVLRRLKMFVLRAKVAFSQPALTLCGVSAPQGLYPSLSDAAGGALPQVPWTRCDLPTGTWIAAPAVAGRLRWWWAADAGQQAAATPTLRPMLVPADESLWRADDIAAGLPWIDAPTQDVFTPQNVNMDLTEGVSFTKGCYPGQEVVARSHYRGTIKRRTAFGTIAGTSDASAMPGQDVYAPDRADEPCGRILDAAGTGTHTSVLVETTLASMTGGSLRLGAHDGTEIQLGSLPYALS